MDTFDLTKNQGEVARWSIAGLEENDSSATADLVMAWARDAESGEPRYIFELGPDKHGAKCGCECYSCGLPLTAVNAGKMTWHMRPHFRHPNGAQKNDCLVLSARAAALEALRKEGTLTLPSRRRNSRVAGLSGKYYDAWVATPPEPVRISNFSAVDRVGAILTLDDGRQLRVSLTGNVESQDGSSAVPTIVLAVDDPRIAAMSPAQLKQRLHLLVEQGGWCGHWKDAELAAEATEAAKAQADYALDWLDGAGLEGLPPESSRETILHWLAKDILAQEKRIRLPDLEAIVEVDLPNGHVERRVNSIPGMEVRLGEVTREKRLGCIQPDVLAEVATGSNEATPLETSPLLIEITVTHGIDEERLSRIRLQNLPTLEINVSLMGGNVTKDEFIRLLIDEVAGKRWVHHPWLEQEKAKMELELAPVRQAVATSADDWGRRYLDAVVAHSNLRAYAEERSTSREQIAGALALVKQCAEGLAIHGYPEAKDEELYRVQGNILDRLLTIRDDHVVGYRIDSTWQVLNAILCEGEPYLEWQSLYLAAIRVYRPRLSEKHSDAVEAWRTHVLASLRNGEAKYRRSARYDKLISLLFPEMASLLGKPFPHKLAVAPPMQNSTPPQQYRRSYETNIWLSGRELEEWKRRNPEAAERWFGKGRDK